MILKKTLTIAGFDPTGWAGLLADAMVFKDMGTEPLGVPTAITVQDLLSVSEVAPLEAGLLSRQICSVLRTQTVAAVKIGMLATGRGAKAVAEALQKSPAIIVLDPVIASTGGTPLIDEEGLTVIKESLIPMATLVTPNMGEASVLTGSTVADIMGMKKAAECIHKNLKPGAVLVKGGHMNGEPIDVLFDGREFTEFQGSRLIGPREVFHGTGCLLSSAITAGLTKGLCLKDAVREGKDHTEKILKKRKRYFPDIERQG